MLTRRALLTGGVLTGSVAGVVPGADGAGAPQARSGSDSQSDEKIVKVLEDIRDNMRGDSGAVNPELATIRALQKDFLKSRGKFPDFIEVGIDVWESLMNWHVRTRQPIQVQRTAEGHYSVAIFQTNIVLRHDVSSVYVGPAYDAK